MRVSVISFSVCGAALAKRMSTVLSEQGYEVNGYITSRHAPGMPFEPFTSVYKLAARLFDDTDALVFISACGIAVRAIAPLIKSKLTDPAVVVCDEAGRFSISLLSGHVGGANLMAEEIAGIIGAIPVITTASEIHAVPGDVFAAADLPGASPGQFYQAARCNIREPQNLVLGIGCRRGLSAETVERAATIMLWDQKIPLARVCEVATIDVKRNDEGLLGFVKAHRLSLKFFTAAELNGVIGSFSSSDRVLQAVGVDNICERAATLCGGKGRLIMGKTAKDGVTAAVFEKEQ